MSQQDAIAAGVTAEETKDPLKQAHEDLKPKKFFIPEEFRDEVFSLAEATAEEDLRHQAARSRQEKAIEAGDANLAISERKVRMVHARAHNEAQNKLWARIREVIPDLPAQYQRLNAYSFEVAGGPYSRFNGGDLD